MCFQNLKPVLPAVRSIAAVLCLTVASVNPGFAHKGDKGKDAKITVMTQNQYLGADLEPLVTASDPIAFNEALVFVLQTIGASNYPERVQELARTIKKNKPDLVGLQEMWSFECTPTSATFDDPCSLFGPAFNDHLTETLEALQDIDAGYYEAATVQNIAFEDTLPGSPFPGIPIHLDGDGVPEIFLTFRDRDVILARDDVEAVPVTYDCVRPSLDGCNFETVAETTLGGLPFNIERGFVAVDAIVKGRNYRFVNTHLEVRFPDPSFPLSRFIQSAQASELMGLLTTQPAPLDSRLLLVGDINSAPDDVFPAETSGPFLTPYQQFVTGLSLAGAVISAPYLDAWTEQKKGKPKPGLTCCEAADLRNEESQHDRRIDVIFSLDEPKNVKAKVLNVRKKDKTDSGLWPSDHATVVAKFKFRDRD